MSCPCNSRADTNPFIRGKNQAEMFISYRVRCTPAIALCPVEVWFLRFPRMAS
jgi:hypothetical protein